MPMNDFGRRRGRRVLASKSHGLTALVLKCNPPRLPFIFPVAASPDYNIAEMSPHRSIDGEQNTARGIELELGRVGKPRFMLHRRFLGRTTNISYAVHTESPSPLSFLHTHHCRWFMTLFLSSCYFPGSEPVLLFIKDSLSHQRCI